jgi:hypothetical protein
MVPKVVAWFREFVLSKESETLIPRLRCALLSPAPTGFWTFFPSADTPLVARWKRRADSSRDEFRIDAYYDARWPERIWLVKEQDTLYWISREHPTPQFVCMEYNLGSLVAPSGPSDSKLTFYARGSTQRKFSKGDRRFLVLELDPVVEARFIGPFGDRDCSGMVSYDRIKPGAVSVRKQSGWGDWLVTSFERSLRLWDLTSAKTQLKVPGNDRPPREVPLDQVSRAHQSGVGTISTIPGSRTIVTTGKSENDVFLWTVATPKSSPRFESRRSNFRAPDRSRPSAFDRNGLSDSLEPLP